MAIFKDFDDEINSLISKAKNANNKEIDEILKKAASFNGLAPYEVAVLLTCDINEYENRILQIAGKIKQHIYGNRIVLFAPLYLSDYCINSCTYCGFKNENNRKRRKLTQEEIKKEVKVLETMGHKRLAIEVGEDPTNASLGYVLQSISTIYNMKFESGEIRRVNVNMAAMETEDYKRLKNAEIGTYILFQESYHRPTYEKVHVAGPKSNFDYHLSAFDRAMEAGVDDVGAGVLFGLYDYKYEVLGLMLHNKYLEDKFGVGFHTISVPRIRDKSTTYPFAVNDREFLQLVSILRMAVPFTGMILSTREKPEMRKTLINAGISQISAGSKTMVGGYSQMPIDETKQFEIYDNRDTNSIIYWLMEEGILPSFCTACYRSGRSGSKFMNLAKSGNIKEACIPNGLLTLKEYALDYGDPKFNKLADKIIDNNLASLKNQKLIKDKLEKLNLGERDVFV